MPLPISLTKKENSIYNYLKRLSLPVNNRDGISKQASVDDEIADIVFKIWCNSSFVKNNSRYSQKLYKISPTINTSDLLRAKQAGLIREINGYISFTEKGAAIIKNMTLAEQNKFCKNSIKKPYSLILAEQKKPKRKSLLALAQLDKKKEDYKYFNLKQYLNFQQL